MRADLLRRNPALLKLDLYCRGARVDDALRVEDEGGRPILRTRAGLGSGLEVVLPGGHWTNVPVAESFAERSPYLVTRRPDGTLGLDRDGEPVAPLRLAPRPAWYDQRTRTGKRMTAVGTLQGTYLGVYPARVCEFWTRKPERANCHFCSVGLNLGADDGDEKAVAEVVEVAVAARRDSDITYVDFNTGHHDDEGFLDQLEPYVRAVKEATGCLIGVQTPPHHDLARYERLREIGVNRVSFCFELFDADRFEEVCPGKAAHYGLRRYLEAIEHCAAMAPGGATSRDPWVTNGEIIAGLEPPESSIAAIRWLTARGAIPTVCVFRPLRGTDYEDLAPPRTEDVVPVFAALWESCMEHGLPIGLAPNVNVSLVMLPEEARGLVSRSVRRRYALREALLGVKGRVLAHVLRRRLRARDRARARRSLSGRRAPAADSG